MTLYDVIAESAFSALASHNQAGNYAEKCTRFLGKAEATAAMKILLTGISNFYGLDASTVSAAAGSNREPSQPGN